MDNKFVPNLDYVQTREIAHLAIRRAAIFLGFGMNAARNDELTDCSLAKEARIEFAPRSLPIEALKEIKFSFEQWIVSNGIRELVEGFSVFLDRIYENSLAVSVIGKFPPPDIQPKLNAFAQKGIPGKQKALREEFNISYVNADYLIKLSEVRNCLSHNRGVVTENYCNSDDGVLEVSWLGLDASLGYHDGRLIPFENVDSLNPVASPELVQLKFLQRKKVFGIGSVVQFSPRELAEICLFMLSATEGFARPAEAFCKEKLN